ncbi:MAG TPA: sigma-54 dependent transcriptional regulator [Marinobacterium sp.]|nr:sigma-54 dependent transcriptional regulator [Marinobacterium sp.]
MSDKRAEVLIVEDSASLRKIYTEYLRTEGIQVDVAGNLQEAHERLRERDYPVILLDVKLPDGDGFDLLKELTEQGSNTLVIVMTAHGSIGKAVDAMRLGAYDFLEKPFDSRRLKTTMRSALVQLENQVFRRDGGDAEKPQQFHSFIGGSDPMQEVYGLIKRAAPSKASVFITGESGTGKELCAEALHRQSARSDGPFVAINCAAIPKDLMESEIFGHVKGSFTGATANREGAATLANGGTLFLDEIGEMSFDLQTKMLRFIQTGVVQKVGSNKDEVVDVRFICATNREPLEEVRAGRFREDLYYRLHVIPISMPALRERSDDIMLIANQFLRRFAREEAKQYDGFSPKAEAIFKQYSWPGNVRELQNVVRNIVVLSQGGIIDVKQLPPPLDSFSAQVKESESDKTKTTRRRRVKGNGILAATVADIRPMAEVERLFIENAISLCEGNIPKAAALLELSPSTIYRKKQAWEEA